MAENEVTNAGGDQGSSSDRDSFLERLARGAAGEPSGGTSDSGSDSNGSGSGTDGNGSDGSDGGSEQVGSGVAGNSVLPQAGIGSDQFSPASPGGDRGGRDYTGKRGRHPNDCICGNCEIRRAAISAGTDPNEAKRAAGKEQRARRTSQAAAPEFVDWGDIFPGMQQGKAPKVDDLFSLAYSTLFEVVKYARNEDHWPISKEEAAKLGKVSTSCLNTVPQVQRAKVEQKVGKYLPWLALMGFGMVITYPRVALSVQLEKAKKASRFPAPVKFPIREENQQANERSSIGVAPPSVAVGNSENRGTNFPPGNGANLPPLDYIIPSPTDRDTSN